jgi:hypothetical protein
MKLRFLDTTDKDRMVKMLQSGYVQPVDFGGDWVHMSDIQKVNKVKKTHCKSQKKRGK